MKKKETERGKGRRKNIKTWRKQQEKKVDG